MSLIRYCALVLLGASLSSALPPGEAQAQGKKCTTEGAVYRCVFPVSDLVELTTTSPGEKSPITGIVIVAGDSDIKRMLEDVELILSSLLPSTTEIDRRETVLKLLDNLNKRPPPRFKLGNFELWSSERQAKLVIEGKAFR